MPDAGEFPRVGRAVVPLVGAWHAFVNELIPGWLPGLPAIVRALDDLPKPAGGLRGVNASRVDRRTLEVIDFPAAEMRSADLPLLALAVRAEDESTLAGADQNPYCAHGMTPYAITGGGSR